MSRYARQMIMPEFGETGQRKLRDARVVVVGAGGLGSPVLSYLAGAGVGQIAIIDPDSVEESNLHRQPLFRMADIGKPKAQAAAAAIAHYNPDVCVTAHAERLEPANAAALCDGADVVIDAADSFAATYTLSDHCLASGQTLVSASVLGFTGYAGGYCGGRAPSVRAVFPDLPRSAGDCATAGVSGPAVGVLGSLQAQMAMNYLLGIAPSPLGIMIRVDLMRLSVSNFFFTDAGEPAEGLRFISASDLRPNDLLIDLRSTNEAPDPVAPQALRTQADQVVNVVSNAAGRRVVLCCRSGLRAWNAALSLRQTGHEDLALIAAGPA
ncbi:ThiF family adenylyltransferase [Pelagibacterium halotolerans]|uniref:ThiF family adenylyltransferase n=1 Tax=Pelagibacterium halotolerans TaxID=531813 RepID=UPI00384E18F8